jgi:hypothetical protein
MHRYPYWLRGLSCGAVSLGLLQAFGAVSFNQVWFNFLITILSIFVTAVFGGDLEV